MAKTDLHGLIRRTNEPTDADTPPGIPSALHVAAGQDRFGEQRRLGINTIDYKVTSQDSTDLLIVEITALPHIK